MSRADDYIAQAQQAEDAAAGAPNKEVERQFLEMARQWRELAVRAGYVQATDKPATLQA
jgi:hypothetical protein